MEIDDNGPGPDRPELALQGGPGDARSSDEPRLWNKGQMAIIHSEPQPHIDPDGMEDGESGLTGRRANPGGGQRWAFRARHWSLLGGRGTRG
jgi:hypothetical protein